MALSLPVSGSGKNLDLCAAPGGKTLVISSVMDEDAVLFSNERSGERKARLSKVVSSCLPEEISSRVRVSCSDGSTWCRRETEAYSAVLLDAPCSSERHVLSDPKYLDVWTPSRIKTVSMEQWALLSCAWRLLEKGGYMVYSTCAITPSENQDNISKLLKKFDDVEKMDQDFVRNTILENGAKIQGLCKMPGGMTLDGILERIEPLEHGFHILPDNAYGTGPLFFCVLHKSL